MGYGRYADQRRAIGDDADGCAGSSDWRGDGRSRAWTTGPHLKEARKELGDAESGRIDAALGHVFLLICVLAFDWDAITLMGVFLFESVVLVPLVFYTAPTSLGRVEYLVLGPGLLLMMFVFASHVGLFALDAGAVTLESYRWDRALGIALALAMCIRAVPLLVRRIRSEYLAHQLHFGVTNEFAFFLSVFMGKDLAVSTLARFSGVHPDACLAALDTCWAAGAVVHPLTLLGFHSVLELWFRHEGCAHRRKQVAIFEERLESDRQLREKLADLRRRNPG